MNSSPFILIGILMFFSQNVLAQNNKGISFQAVIKRADGTYPTVAGVSVNLKVLTGSGCVLRDEDVSGVNISNGYLNLVVGKGNTNGSDLCGWQ